MANYSQVYHGYSDVTHRKRVRIKREFYLVKPTRANSVAKSCTAALVRQDAVLMDFSRK